MPAKKKTTVSKDTAAPKAVKKAAVKKAEPVKAAPAKKAAPKKAAAKASPAPAKKAAVKKTPVKKGLLTPEERYQRVQTEAYYIAEQHGFGGDDMQYWLLAEQKVAKDIG